jgi:hypothetical protein
MSTKKQYKLLKDLPDAKAGTIFTSDGEDGGYYYPDLFGRNQSWCWKEPVEQEDSEWFEEIKPEVKEERNPFIHEKVYELEEIKRKAESFLAAYKQSKQPIDTKEEKTERIKVNIGTLDSGGDRGRPHEYPLVTSHPIPVEKIPLLREAIENVLNSISQPNIPNK